MRKSMILIILIVVVIGGVFISYAGFYSGGGTNSTVITYGETTFNNQEYKDIVGDYFTNQAHMDLNNVNNEIITASEVNAISQNISQQTYNSNQIFSSALLNLDEGNDIKIDVDTSKITLVTDDMYKSALESSGITKGHVIVTSPVSATGESALAGIMASYESATNTTIPNDVKQAATDEIYTEAEIVNNSNLSADDLSNIVSDVKQEVEKQNTTDKQTIINIINNVTINNNVQISDNDINNLAGTIQQTQSVQDQAVNYQNEISNYLGTNGFSLDNIFNYINSFFR